MNKGVVQNSTRVQQMMANANNNNNNPSSSLWNINNLIISSSPSSSCSNITNLLAPPSNNNIITPTNHTINNLFQLHQYNNNTMNINMSTTLSSSWLLDDDNQPPPFPESLSQLLLSGVYMGEEGKKMGNWEEQLRLQQQHNSLVDHLKQENSVNSYNNKNVYCNNNNDQEFQLASSKATNWGPHQSNNIPASSPQSCISTTFSDNLHATRHTNNPLTVISDHSSECNSSASGGALKKPKVQPSSTQPTFKVRKEKLGDRITVLHQLVSPFGKTDTASVLLEAIGYVRFLHSQIEALSLPYLTNGAGDKTHTNIVEGERKCIFPEDPGQLLNNDNCLKRKGVPDHQQDSYEKVKDLRSRGLCLVPLSSTMHVGSDNGADYWAPAIGGGGFR